MNVRCAALAYGDEDAVFRQAEMLFISLVAHAPPSAEFVLLTDKPERFEWLGNAVKLEVLSRSDLARWRGSTPFSMRQKIEAASVLLPEGGALIMLDADTLAIRPLGPVVEQLTGGSLLMHKREYDLGAARRRGNRRLWEDLRGRSFDGWEFLPSDAMWNSGVIGLTDRDRPLLGAALKLYDALGEAGVRHFMIEQLAVGVTLQRTGRLLPAERFFAHYWGNKPGFDAEISRRLAAARSSGSTVADAAAALRANPIALPVDVRPGPLSKIASWLTR